MIDHFEPSLPVYNQGVVIRLLRNYVAIRQALIDRMPTPTKPIYTHTQRHTFVEKPVGSSGNSAWPFMTKPHAMQRVDGKKRARMLEDLHCATMDLEAALQQLSDDEFKLLADYYIYGNGTLDELAQARGLLSKGRLQEKIQRLVRKLVRYMNQGEETYES